MCVSFLEATHKEHYRNSQSANPEFGNILRRLREHWQTEEDLQRVNSRVVPFHSIGICYSTQFITKTNAVRHTVNLNAAFQYATSILLALRYAKYQRH